MQGLSQLMLCFVQSALVHPSQVTSWLSEVYSPEGAQKEEGQPAQLCAGVWTLQLATPELQGPGSGQWPSEVLAEGV